MAETVVLKYIHYASISVTLPVAIYDNTMQL